MTDNSDIASDVHYYPPDGVTPALARLIWQGRYDLKVFTTALVTLAAKGWLAIDTSGNAPVLLPQDGTDVLHAREKALFDRLFRGGRDKLALDGRAYLDLQQAQAVHYSALMEEDQAFYRSALTDVRFIGRVVTWLWPMEAKRTRRVRKQAEGYKRYLGLAMRHRLDPVFRPGGTLDEVCRMMPYVVAFDVQNSWADEFAASVADLLSDDPVTTSIYALGDRAGKRSKGGRKFRNPAERRRQEEEDRNLWHNDFY